MVVVLFYMNVRFIYFTFVWRHAWTLVESLRHFLSGCCFCSCCRTTTPLWVVFGWFTSCRHGAKVVGSNQQVELTWPAPQTWSDLCLINIFLQILGFLRIKKMGFLMWMQFTVILLETCFICLLIKLWYSTQRLLFSYSSVCLFVKEIKLYCKLMMIMLFWIVSQ